MQLAKRKEPNSNNQMTEKEYRKIQVLNYSAIRKFSQDRRAFYNEFILNQPKKEKESDSLILGSLIHCLLAGQEFDDKFHILNAAEPKPQLKLLADELYYRTIVSMNEEGIQTEKFEVLFTDAVHKVKWNFNGEEVAFKGKSIEKIVEMFSDSDAEIYYKEKLAAHGKTVVSINTIQQAEKLVEKLKSHSYTSEYANIRTGGEGDIEVFNELAILFEINDIPYKSLIDKLIIRHESKLIEVLDWKSSWDSTAFAYSYIKNGYYIQAVLYDYAVKHWAKENGYEDYVIEPMKFIVIDTTGFSTPIVYKVSREDLVKAWEGFRIKAYHKGVLKIMKEIQWHINTGIWDVEKEVYDKQGILSLDINYEQVEK